MKNNSREEIIKYCEFVRKENKRTELTNLEIMTVIICYLNMHCKRPIGIEKTIQMLEIINEIYMCTVFLGTPTDFYKKCKKGE